MAAWREDLETAQPRPRAAVIEVPRLFESGLDHGFDATIAVIADEPTREARAAAGGHEAPAERGAWKPTRGGKVAACHLHRAQRTPTPAELETKLSAILDRLLR